MASPSRMPSRGYFEQFSRKTGFQAITLEKIYRVVHLVDEVFSSDSARNLALRGGTAINLFYLRTPPRLSVDVDLVYVGDYRKEAMIKDRETIDESLKRTFRFFGYPLENPKRYALDQYILRYVNQAGSKDNVKVEVNYLSCRVPIFRPVRRTMKSPFGLHARRTATMLAPEELYGSKIKALIERAQPRDLFDVAILKEQVRKLDFMSLKRAFIFYSALELESDFRKMSLAAALGRLDERKAKNVLTPTLSRDYDLNVKRLKSSAIGLVNRILKAGRVENEFLDAFYAGKYRPELLFPASESLRHHPGAAWRMRQLGLRA